MEINRLRVPMVKEDRKALRRIVDAAAEPDDDYARLAAERPRTRKDCIDGPRPCPFVSCRHNTYLTVWRDGSITMPAIDVMDMKVSNCALDYAEGANLREVAAAMNMSLQGVQQAEVKALESASCLKEMLDFPRERRSGLAVAADDYASGG